MARRLVFTVGAERLALPAEAVREVAALPQLTRVPNAPAALLGLANLRGAVMPVVSLAALLGGAAAAAPRAIILHRAEPVALALGGVPHLAEEDGAKMLDIEALLAEHFRPRAGPGKGARVEAAAAIAPAEAQRPTVGVLGFTVSGQAFALALEEVQELIALPEDIAALPGGDAAALGSVAHRGALLPLLDLRRLLQLPERAAPKPRIVVARIDGQAVGLRVDAVEAILRVAEHDIDTVPAVLARGTAEAKVQAIIRRDGQRLVSLLASDHLLRQSGSAPRPRGASKAAGAAQLGGAIERFLIFRLGDAAFGLPVAAVREVAAMPARLTRLPKAPAFVEGVMNLRGEAIAVIDQRRRFKVQGPASGRRRLIVAALGGLTAGFAVDAVTEVLPVPAGALRPAPELGEGARVFDRIASLEGGARMVLVIEPAELLNGAERDLLAELGAPALGAA